jgi:hypothetical protein
MPLEIWVADAMIVGVIGFMILGWVFEPRAGRAPVRAAAKPRKHR